MFTSVGVILGLFILLVIVSRDGMILLVSIVFVLLVIILFFVHEPRLTFKIKKI